MRRIALPSNRTHTIAQARLHPRAVRAPAFGQNAAPPVPAKPRMVINCGGGGWKDGQVQEPCILVNPKDAGKLIMFYAGMKLGGREGAIAKAWADVADPFTWHEDAKPPLLNAQQGVCVRRDRMYSP